MDLLHGCLLDMHLGDAWQIDDNDVLVIIIISFTIITNAYDATQRIFMHVFRISTNAVTQKFQEMEN